MTMRTSSTSQFARLTHLAASLSIVLSVLLLANPVSAQAQPAIDQEVSAPPTVPNAEQLREANEEEGFGITPGFGLMADDGRQGIEDFIPGIRCSTWTNPISYSYLRRGYYDAFQDSGFGRIKAQVKHNIGRGDGTNIDNILRLSEVRRVWEMTLYVSMLDGGCNANRSDSHRGRFDTEFVGLSCTWGGRACIPNPQRNVTVRSVEEMGDSNQITSGDKKLGNLTLHCLISGTLECPSWLPRATPFRTNNQ